MKEGRGKRVWVGVGRFQSGAKKFEGAEEEEADDRQTFVFSVLLLTPSFLYLS